MDKSIIILGNGKHSRVIAELAELLSYKVLGYIDLYKEQSRECLGSISNLERISSNHPDAYYTIATGNNYKREEISRTFPNLRYVRLISPSAYISKSAIIGEGSVILHNSIINTQAEIGKHTLINTNVIVEHDNIIGDFVHLSPGVVLGGTVSIGDFTHLGLNSSLRNNISIPDKSIIGMGSVVTKTITKQGVYYGNPVRFVKHKKEE